MSSLIFSSIEDVVYLETGKSGLVCIQRGKKHIVPHWSLIDVISGLFNITEIDEREKVIIVKGDNIEALTEIPDPMDFMLDNAFITGFEEILTHDHVKMINLIGMHGNTFTIPTVNGTMVSLPVEFSRNIRHRKPIHVDEVNALKGLLGLNFLRQTRYTKHDPFSPAWVRKDIDLSIDDTLRLSRGKYEYVSFPIPEHIPVAWRRHVSTTRDERERLIDYNEDIVQYWQTVGFKKHADKPEMLTAISAILNAHPSWNFV